LDVPWLAAWGVVASFRSRADIAWTLDQHTVAATGSSSKDCSVAISGDERPAPFWGA
jgi:hypothetical protein